jgi:hypothetical protein
MPTPNNRCRSKYRALRRWPARTLPTLMLLEQPASDEYA